MKPGAALLVALVAAAVGAVAGYWFAQGQHGTQLFRAALPEPTRDDNVKRLAEAIAERDRLRAENERLRNQSTLTRPETPDPAPVETPDPKAVQPAETPAPAAGAEATLKGLRDQLIKNAADPAKAFDALQLLAALAKHGDVAAREALLASLKHESEDVRANAVEATDDLGIVDRPEILTGLLALVNDPSAKVRDELAQALESAPPESAGPVLVKMLADADLRVLRAAVYALGELKYEAAHNDLVPLVNHADEGIRFAAARALRRMGDTAAAETWVPTLAERTKSTDSKARQTALRQLRSLKLESARPYIEALLKDPDPAIAREADRALKELDK